jgi:hypothetical protein
VITRLMGVITKMPKGCVIRATAKFVSKLEGWRPVSLACQWKRGLTTCRPLDLRMIFSCARIGLSGCLDTLLWARGEAAPQQGQGCKAQKPFDPRNRHQRGVGSAVKGEARDPPQPVTEIHQGRKLQRGARGLRVAAPTKSPDNSSNMPPARRSERIITAEGRSCPELA